MNYLERKFSEIGTGFGVALGFILIIATLATISSYLLSLWRLL